METLKESKTKNNKRIAVNISGAEAIIHCLIKEGVDLLYGYPGGCLLYTSPSPRDQRGSRMPSSA